MPLPDVMYEEAARLVFDYWEREASAVRAARGEPAEIILWGDLSPEWRAKWRGVIANVVDMSARVILSDMYAKMAGDDDDLSLVRLRAVKRYGIEQFAYDPSGLINGG